MRQGKPGPDKPEQKTPDKSEQKKERKRRLPSLPFKERLFASVDEVAEQLGCGRNTVYNQISAGKLKVVKVNSLTRITTESVLALKEAA